MRLEQSDLRVYPEIDGQDVYCQQLRQYIDSFVPANHPEILEVYKQELGELGELGELTQAIITMLDSGASISEVTTYCETENTGDTSLHLTASLISLNYLIRAKFNEENPLLVSCLDCRPI